MVVVLQKVLRGRIELGACVKQKSSHFWWCFPHTKKEPTARNDDSTCFGFFRRDSFKAHGVVLLVKRLLSLSLALEKESLGASLAEWLRPRRKKKCVHVCVCLYVSVCVCVCLYVSSFHAKVSPVFSSIVDRFRPIPTRQTMVTQSDATPNEVCLALCLFRGSISLSDAIVPLPPGNCFVHWIIDA